jgi:hypothetical protein
MPEAMKKALSQQLNKQNYNLTVFSEPQTHGNHTENQ